ncbi:hypothetical protein D3C72_1730120 [compost metagenome]
MPTPTTMRLASFGLAPKPATSLLTMATAINSSAKSNMPRVSGLKGLSAKRSTDAPTLTKKIGVKMSATGRSWVSSVCWCSVSSSSRPAAKAPIRAAEPTV